MKGIDCAGQYIFDYSVLREMVKWTKQVVCLMNCTLFNAFKKYNLGARNKIKYKSLV